MFKWFKRKPKIYTYYAKPGHHTLDNDKDYFVYFENPMNYQLTVRGGNRIFMRGVGHDEFSAGVEKQTKR